MLSFVRLFRGDLLDKETDVLDGERAPVVTEGDVRVRAFQVRLDAHANLAADIHVLGVLDQLPDPALGYRRRCIHAASGASDISLWIFVAMIWLSDLCLQRGEFFCKRHGSTDPLDRVYLEYPVAVRFRANATYVDFMGVAGLPI